MTSLKNLVLVLLFLIVRNAIAADVVVSSNKVDLPTFVNTNSNITMLNLSISSGTESILLKNLIVNFNSTGELNASNTNLSVCVYLSEMNSSNLLGCNSLWNVSGNVNQTNITISNLTINQTAKTMLITYRIFRNVSVPMNVSLFVLNDSFIFNTTNLTINFVNGVAYNATTKYFSSNFTQIQDLHATANLLPRYADTNVKNQEIIYIINSTGKDIINSTIINLPNDLEFEVSGYSIIKTDNTNLSDTACAGYCNKTQNEIKVSYFVNNIGIKAVTLRLKINTTTEEKNLTINSTISGGNLSNIQTDFNEPETTLIVKQLLNVTDIGVMKNTAIVNGTDYWLFNFTVNITANVSGLIQFKMDPWRSDSKNITIPLTNGTGENKTYYASMWLSTNTSNIFNVTEEYSSGILLNATANKSYTLILKMIIPRNTPIANDWWTTYSILFRTIA
jgi:hypothetical protein